MTEFTHNEILIVKQLPPEMQQVYYAWKIIQKLGGNGSIEIHFVRGKIKENNGIFMKPGIGSDVLNSLNENGGI